MYQRPRGLLMGVAQMALLRVQRYDLVLLRPIQDADSNNQKTPHLSRMAYAGWESLQPTAPASPAADASQQHIAVHGSQV